MAAVQLFVGVPKPLNSRRSRSLNAAKQRRGSSLPVRPRCRRWSDGDERSILAALWPCPTISASTGHLATPFPRSRSTPAASASPGPARRSPLDPRPLRCTSADISADRRRDAVELVAPTPRDRGSYSAACRDVVRVRPAALVARDCDRNTSWNEKLSQVGGAVRLSRQAGGARVRWALVRTSGCRVIVRMRAN